MSNFGLFCALNLCYKIGVKEKIKVAVGMSGGVDSSVAAMLLKKAGYDVVGLFLKLWSDPTCEISRDNACCDEKALMDARKVADQLGIPFFVVDARAKFHDEIVDYYLDEYKNLRTPNPCVVCNKKIKFGWMLEFAEKLGCEMIATGHYCRIKPVASTSPSLSLERRGIEPEGDNYFRLLKGVDSNKDQSYFLWQLSQEQLSKIMFPLGEMTKEEVRKIAKKAKLPVYEKKESQEICFIDGDYREFLKKHLGAEFFKPGRIVDQDGFTVGRHEGLVNYTVGQRKGIEQAGTGNKGPGTGERKPLYVTGFDLEKNELVVGSDEEVFRSEMIVEEVNWIRGTRNEEQGTGGLKVKIRYRAEAVACEITQIPNSKPASPAGGFQIRFDTPQRAVTPGQSAVFYDGDEVIGGGTIQ